MTKTKKIDLILTLLIIFLIILALPKLLLNNKGKNLKVLETSLLNTKYLEKINSIYLGDSVDTLHFQKKGDIWLCTYGDLVFFADNKIISQLLTNFSKTRNIVQVSTKTENLSLYGLTKEDAFNISFFQEDLAGNKNEFSAISFGMENADRTRIYLKTNRKNTVYSMENDLYQYFNTRLETFGLMELIPIQDSKSESLVESIEIVDFSKDNVKTIKKLGDEDFSDIVHRLFSLRGSTLFQEDILASDNMKLLKSFTLKTSKNTFYNIEIYSYTNSISDEQFFVRTDFSEKDSSVNYVLEISAWTKSRLDF